MANLNALSPPYADAIDVAFGSSVLKMLFKSHKISSKTAPNLQEFLKIVFLNDFSPF